MTIYESDRVRKTVQPSPEPCKANINRPHNIILRIEAPIQFVAPTQMTHRLRLPHILRYEAYSIFEAVSIIELVE